MTSIPQIKNALSSAFADRTDIAEGLQTILDRSVFDATTMKNLADYVLALKSAVANGNAETEPHSKKRKIGGEAQEMADVGGSVLFNLSDISFSVPIRKKLKLEGLKGGLRAVDAAGKAEVMIGWDKVEHVFCLPVPDRAKPQQNFVILPSQAAQGVESVVFTAPEQNPKNPNPQHTADYVTQQLDSQLARFNKQVLYPDEAEFVSQAGSKAGRGKTFSVRVHRGSKEGHLFFLAPGILFAFKKPLLFLPFHSITSISYTSVLQRTFNLNIAARETASETETEIEFSMVDQEDYAGIDDYIKRHGLNDASLADKRRAKVYGVNAPKNAGATTGADAPGTTQVQNGAVAGEGDESELQKAERMLQDAEDEDEEDYVAEEDEGSSEDEDYEEGEGDEEEYGDDDDVEEEYDNEEGGYEDEGDAVMEK